MSYGNDETWYGERRRPVEQEQKKVVFAGGLTFDELRRTNVTRCETSFHPLKEWSPTDWACAVAGEVGEACNLIKKLKRGDKIDVKDIGKELADAVCYLDLLAASLDIDLGQATIEKFNEVSKRVGSIFML